MNSLTFFIHNDVVELYDDKDFYVRCSLPENIISMEQAIALDRKTGDLIGVFRDVMGELKIIAVPLGEAISLLGYNISEVFSADLQVKIATNECGMYRIKPVLRNKKLFVDISILVNPKYHAIIDLKCPWQIYATNIHSLEIQETILRFTESHWVGILESCKEALVKLLKIKGYSDKDIAEVTNNPEIISNFTGLNFDDINFFCVQDDESFQDYELSEDLEDEDSESDEFI